MTAIAKIKINTVLTKTVDVTGLTFNDLEVLTKSLENFVEGPSVAMPKISHLRRAAEMHRNLSVIIKRMGA